MVYDWLKASAVQCVSQTSRFMGNLLFRSQKSEFSRSEEIKIRYFFAIVLLDGRIWSNDHPQKV